MKGIRALLYVMISITFLSGCVNKEENSESIVLNIPSVNDYTVLYIQPIDKNGGTSESNEVVINDKKKILELIDKVNKMEVVKSPSKDFNERVKKLKQQQGYLVSLSDPEHTTDKQFFMIFFKDGSIQFQYPGENKKGFVLYLSTEKHPELLEDFKELLKLQK